MFSKSRDFFCVIIVVLSVSCVRVVEDPAKKYNTEFLKNNSLRIKKSKEKHLEKAKEHGINYRVREADIVDADYYYKTPVGTKAKKNYRTNSEDNDKKKDIKYLGTDISIYHKQRNLKDKEDYILDRNRNNKSIFYVKENYSDYAEEKITFNDITPTTEKLYGDLKLRKEKRYNSINNRVMQESFDYIDIMNRIKKEMYLKDKENETINADKRKTNVTTNIRSKFMNLFK
jgi:hypothetical protein